MEDIKRRRMHLMRQMESNQSIQQNNRKSTSQSRVRLSSIERRKQIQQNLNQHVQTKINSTILMASSREKFFKTQQSFPNIKQQNQDQVSYNQPLVTVRNNNLKKQYEEVLNSPSFKNIQFEISPSGKSEALLTPSPNQRKYQIQQKQQIIPHFQLPVTEHNDKLIQNKNSSPKQKQDVFESQKIQYPLNLNVNFSPKNGSQRPLENQSNSSDIFFTSQFQEFLNKKNQTERKFHQDIEQKIISNTEVQSKEQINEPFQKQHQKNKQPIKADPIQQIEQHVNFQSPIKEPTTLPIIDHIQEQVNAVEDEKRYLTKHKSPSNSHASLALSHSENNSELLKYSLAESNLINAKEFSIKPQNHENIIKNKLIIDDMARLDDKNQKTDFNQDLNDDSSLYIVLKFQLISQKLAKTFMNNYVQDFLLLSKVYDFSCRRQNRLKQLYFDAFKINQQLNFEQKKNDMKCDKFLLNKQQRLFYSIFAYLKQQFYLKPRQKIEIATQYSRKLQHEQKQKIFRFLKIQWYDKKMLKQIDLYYLSKIFSHFGKAIKNQKAQNKSKYVSQYCYWLKKRMFSKFRQGIETSQNQRMINDNANWHYIYGVQKRVFSAWRDKTCRNDKYISLAMTMKNTFRETKGQKWIMIKTVDFKQIQ